MKALGLAVAARRVGPGADMANADLLEAAVGGVARSAEPLSVMIRSTMTPRRLNQPSARLRKATALSFFSSGRSSVGASREASSMQTEQTSDLTQ